MCYGMIIIINEEDDTFSCPALVPVPSNDIDRQAGR